MQILHFSQVNYLQKRMSPYTCLQFIPTAYAAARYPEDGRLKTYLIDSANLLIIGALVADTKEIAQSLISGLLNFCYYDL